jgi:hypothetical protein
MSDNRVEVKFLEKVEQYDIGDIGYITEKVAISLGNKIERVEKHILAESNKAILSPKSTK